MASEVTRDILVGDLLTVGSAGRRAKADNYMVIDVGVATVMARCRLSGYTITLPLPPVEKRTKHVNPRLPYAGGRKGKPRGRSAKKKEVKDAG